MNGFSAAPDEIRAYGSIAAGAAAHIAATEGLEVAANVAALTPVFGVIGADFLATYATTQATHAGSVAALAHSYAGTGSVAHAIAAAYDAADQNTSTVLGAAQTALGENA
ncbi:ESX-1 secretion-associated protein [Rhodococcus xishaensis]|uniref:ESX-1 secretion-associated protein n=1 Tax=Rhodococcus xishaensis TaxID=2487364 RepID=A0A438AZA1_9NOCA|nr:ESX-1 secretion-associated protein [Rhodococcus xishaensis]RVW04033.1 ESX-1 secretion-associated protein [Rhodococcus xishaensis]